MRTMVRMMQRSLWSASLAVAVVLAAVPGVAEAAAGAWPRTYTQNGAKIVVYQPQVKSWANYSVLDGLAAVAITQPGAKNPIYGVVNFEALTSADFTSGIVTLAETHVTTTNFPNEPVDVAAQLDTTVRNIPLADSTVPLPTVLASLDASKALPKPVPIAVTPPKIYTSTKNAILVVFDRDPIFAPIAGTDLKFAVNTNWAVIADGSTTYLLATDHWLSTTSVVNGPWIPAAAPPSFAKLPDTAAWKDARAHLNAPLLAPSAVPHVYVSTTPADLIYVNGAPSFVPIPGTQLSYVSNTGSNLFIDANNRQWYVLLSGRWYKSASLDGPWTYTSANLPSDFSKIPLNSARGGVLVSVPGTPEAQYVGASMAAPQVATVNPSATHLSPVYSGAPDFEPIAGTSLSYAVNTSYDIIKVTDSLYYACYSGVWFSASSPNGPWAVAGYVPQSIYTIPPSSPLYPDTYVYVYNTYGVPLYAPPPAYNPVAPVLVGFTGGYMGAYWAGAWVYGTGYYYPGWYGGGVYYPYATTWTGGGTYTGGSYYNSKTGYYGNQASVYGPYGGATARSAYNPTTGTYARGGEVYGPNGEAAAGSFYNPRYGASGTTYQAKDAYGSWGNSSVTTKNGTTYAAHQTNANGSVAASTGPHGNTTVAKSNSTGDVYAGHDGNVYRNQDGTWQKSSGNGSWSNVSTPSSASSNHPSSSSASSYHPSSSSGFDSSSLDHDSAARDAGSSGFGGFRGGGGGGFSGGGFGGRR